MKSISLNLTIAIRSLCRHRLRTALAVLGVFLGTSSLIVVYNISESLSEKTKLETESLGKNLIIVTSGIVRRVGPSQRLLSTATTLKTEDSEALRQYSYLVKDTAPSANKPFPVRYGSKTLLGINIVGTKRNFPNIRSFYPERGRFFSKEDEKTLQRVAVLGSAVSRELFGDEDPIGRYIYIYRVPMRVIGVMEPKGVDISGMDQDNQIFIPLSTYMRRFVNIDYINTIYVQARDEAFISPLKREIEALLRARHGKEDFTIIDMKEVTALRSQAMDIVSVLGKISSAVSFTIGAIGILSIMILIVNERRLEIGIRRAIGARKKDIALQFLIESSGIALTGGSIGAVMGFLISISIFRFGSLPFSVSILGIILSTIISILVGIVAGIYPAKRATSIEPVHIIRG